MTTGFFGKIPAAGDFVGRRLPSGFVQGWDRWLSLNVAPLIGTDAWDEHLALRFLSGPSAFGPAAGIILSSRDRAGRRFPLSVVALLPVARFSLAETADRWFARLEDIAADACDGGLTPNQLDAALSALPPPEMPDGEELDGMVVWTAGSDLCEMEPGQPAAVLARLLAADREDIGEGARCS